MKKKLFLEILTFEVFFDIFKCIHDYLSVDTTYTDVRYYFGNEDSGSLKNIPYGQFKIKAYPEQIEYLAKEVLLIEPFGKATDPDEVTEYFVMILNVHNLFGGNYSLLLQEKGHLGAPIENTLKRINLNVEAMTNVVIMCPMNISDNNNIYYQTRYCFENLTYTDTGELYIPYYERGIKIHDNRD